MWRGRSVEVAKDRGTPLIFTPLFEKSSGRPLPLSADQQRCQTYMALAADVRGLLYWDWPAVYQPNWQMLQCLAVEIRQIAPVLLSPTPPQTIVGTVDTKNSPIRMLIKHHEGQTHVIVVNGSPEPMLVRYEFAGGVSARVSRWFDEQTFDMVGGVLEDQIEGYGRRVYRWPSSSAPAGVKVQTTSIATSPAVTLINPIGDQDERITGGGFERDQPGLPGWPLGWHPGDTVMASGATDAVDGTWRLVDNPVHNGRRSLAITKTAAGRADGDAVFNRLQSPAAVQPITVPAHQSPRWSAWLRADRRCRVWVMLGWNQRETFEVSTTWQRFEHQFSAPPDRESFVRIHLVDQGTLWIDDVSVSAHAETPTAN